MDYNFYPYFESAEELYSDMSFAVALADNRCIFSRKRIHEKTQFSQSSEEIHVIQKMQSGRSVHEYVLFYPTSHSRSFPPSKQSKIQITNSKSDFLARRKSKRTRWFSGWRNGNPDERKRKWQKPNQKLRFAPILLLRPCPGIRKVEIGASGRGLGSGLGGLG